MRDKDKRVMRKGRIFSDYIGELREKEGFVIQEVCEGLCTVQEVHYLEKGGRAIDRLLQDAVLERLGVGSEDSEIFLYYDDYKRWEDRHHILHSIVFEEFQKAEELLEKYRLTYCCPEKGEDRLENQFYYSMLAQLRRCQGEKDEELYHLFDRALKLTVPEYDCDQVFDRAVSIKELNLMLEAERYRREGERPERFRKIVKYIDGRKMDNRGRVKIYPKAVYYLCRCMISRGIAEKGMLSDMLSVLSPGGTQKDREEWTTFGLLQYCDKAVDVLRNNGRMYFLWELLSMRETLLGYLEEEIREWRKREGEGNTLARIISLEPLQKENREWKEVLEKIYGEAGIPAETVEDCYLYVVKGVNCINDVIRIRREMLGMSQKELCEGICNIRTLKRLEKRETRPRQEIVGELFERLGMSEEFTRVELVTGSPEVRELWEKIRVDSNNGYLDMAEEKLRRIEELVPGEIRNNQQFLARQKAFLAWQRGEIDESEYCRRLQAALEITLPYEAFLREGEKYLTHGEQKCIHNRMLGLKKDSEEFLLCMRRFEEIYSDYADNGLLETVSGIYNLIVRYVGSMWGNRGEYDRADYYNAIIRQQCLRFRRNGALHDSIYDRWWNNMKRREDGISVEKVWDAEEEITKCIVLSGLEKSTDQDFYQEELNAILLKST